MTPQERWEATLLEINRRLGLCDTATPGPWTADLETVHDGKGKNLMHGGYEDDPWMETADAEFIAAHDPTTMLRVLEGARQLLLTHGPTPGDLWIVCVECGDCCYPRIWPCNIASFLMDAWMPK